MENFKLLAIRPLEGCNPKFTKVLKPGKIYRLYQNYEYFNQQGEECGLGDEIHKVEQNTIVPHDLYKIDDIDLNITAIVGKNGSGKSSLIELLFAAVFLISMQEEILNNQSKKKEKLKETEIRLNKELSQLKSELTEIFSDNKYTKPSIKPYSDHDEEVRNTVFKKQNLDQLIKWKTAEINQLASLTSEYNRLKKEVGVEIIYQISHSVFKLKVQDDGKTDFCKIQTLATNFQHLESRSFQKLIKENTDKDNLLHRPLHLSELFFYTLTLNYSQYALNSKEIGDWIVELFHKNDGYQTPIVINPMRTEGNFDINTENELVKQRLLVNIFTPLKEGETQEKSTRSLTQNRIARQVQITLNKEKIENGKTAIGPINFEDAWKLIEKKFFNGKTISNQRWNAIAKDYIVSKIISIAEKYPPYYKYFNGSEFVNLLSNSKEDPGFLDALEKDDSHIAYKFHQAINFLKYDYSDLYYAAQEPMSIDKIVTKLKSIQSEELKHLIPPSFLDVDVIFDEHDSETLQSEQTNTLHHMSSGEKQYIYSISSIMYHLRYLDSTQLQKNNSDGTTNKNALRYKYTYVNLVFDEIELYYHPELQRNFIYDLRQAISRCNLKHIKSINCIFITHSPFILSDIPKSQLLLLDEGNESPTTNHSETFGANIYDLLEDGFFLRDGFIGKFAMTEIQKLIDTLNQSDNTETKSDIKNRIDLIGEPFLKTKLTSMYYEKYPEEHDKQKEINQLEQRLKQLRR